MKVLIGYFVTESNANVQEFTECNDFDIAYGEDCLRKSHVADVFEEAGFDVIPSIYASAGAASLISKDSFRMIEGKFLEAVQDHLDEIDGIWLMLHGAGAAEGIGSAEHHILHEIRKLTGKYLPIAVCCDPHGNLTEQYVHECTYLRSYRESPHTDSIETMRKCAKELIDLLRHRQNIHAVYRKLPLLFEGEQSVSSDEPVRSINRFMDDLERDPRIRSCSWHVGYIRQDADYVGAGIVVVPQTGADQAYAEEIADKLYDYVWDKRHEFHYTDPTASPAEAVKTALAAEGKPVFVTDSGDNVTAGACGWNTVLLRLAMAEKSDKKLLFANICDPYTYAQLKTKHPGDVVNIRLGVNRDLNSTPVNLEVTVRYQGELRGYMQYDHYHVPGNCVLVSVNGMNIDINIADYRTVMCEEHQFIAAGINWDDYDVIFVKMGYIFPALLEKSASHIMALTDGTTTQDIPHIRFRRIMRPIFPIDEI
ncbi:MAG: M81 family metallopeptidase [Solobacterium sp.]|nr:M81 family metallopeptidase [Solobacterium sp.]